MDRYSLNARLYPIVILLIPIVIIGIFYSFAYESIIHFFSSLGITAALGYFFSNLGRDRGKLKEARLWEKWGGMPTVQLFKYKDNVIDYHTKVRYHKILMELSPPTDQTINFETSPVEDLHDIYISWTKFLITHTRNTKEFPLIFKENISYGFRRNLWGLKNISLIIITITIIANLAFQYLQFSHELSKLPIEFFLSECLLIILALLWLFVINSNWVKIPAFAYAERLLESTDKIKVSIQV